MAKQNKKLSGWAVVLMIFFFPFLLIYLVYRLLKKLTSEPENYEKHSRAVRILAYIFIFAGIFYLIGGLTGELQTDDGSSIVYSITVMLTVCCGGGIAMLSYCNRCKGLAELYQKYARGVEVHRETDISRIASIVGVHYDMALADLEKLMGYGVFTDACIDRENGKILLNEVAETPRVMITMVCPHCGGSSRVPADEPPVCSYCDMPMK